MNIFPITFYLTIWTGGIDVQNSYTSMVFFLILFCFQKGSAIFHQENQGNQTKTRKPHATMDLPTKNLTKAAVLGVDEKKFEERCSDIHLEIYCRFIWPPAKN